MLTTMLLKLIIVGLQLRNSVPLANDTGISLLSSALNLNADLLQLIHKARNPFSASMGVSAPMATRVSASVKIALLVEMEFSMNLRQSRSVSLEARSRWEWEAIDWMCNPSSSSETAERWAFEVGLGLEGRSERRSKLGGENDDSAVSGDSSEATAVNALIKVPIWLCISSGIGTYGYI